MPKPGPSPKIKSIGATVGQVLIADGAGDTYFGTITGTGTVASGVSETNGGQDVFDSPSSSPTTLKFKGIRCDDGSINVSSDASDVLLSAPNAGGGAAFWAKVRFTLSDIAVPSDTVQLTVAADLTQTVILYAVMAVSPLTDAPNPTITITASLGTVDSPAILIPPSDVAGNLITPLPPNTAYTSLAPALVGMNLPESVILTVAADGHQLNELITGGITVYLLLSTLP